MHSYCKSCAYVVKGVTYCACGHCGFEVEVEGANLQCVRKVAVSVTPKVHCNQVVILCPARRQMVPPVGIGAAAMQLATNTHPGALKDQVCSPGGTTIAGVEALENRGFRAAAMAAVAAAKARADEMSAAQK